MSRWSKDLGPGDWVTAVSLWEPWASLMAVGAKRIETRHWPTHHRGPLLICAAQRRVEHEIRDLLGQAAFRRGLAPLAPGRLVTADDLSFGHAVALVDLYDCTTVDLLLSLGAVGSDLPFGNYTPGRFGWPTTGLRRLVPFPVKGRQGLFKVRLPYDLADYPRAAA
ncbi:MAG: ASCH domain-containing protein [Acidobacteriota bacterium]